MKIVRFVGVIIWRIWFYVLMGLTIIFMSPLLLFSTAREKWYPHYYKLARCWAKIILFGMGFYPKVTRSQHMKFGKSYMLVANHTSMIDIMLMLHLVKNPFVFVGKRELAKIPIFGFFYKRTCILVDRSSSKSKKDVFEQANRRLSQGLGVCIFPEGGIPDDTGIVLDSFKDGAFHLAIEHQIPIVPLIFYDNKKRFPFAFFKGSPGKMSVKILPFVETNNLDLRAKRSLKMQVYEMMYKELSGR